MRSPRARRPETPPPPPASASLPAVKAPGGWPAGAVPHSVFEDRLQSLRQPSSHFVFACLLPSSAQDDIERNDRNPIDGSIRRTDQFLAKHVGVNFRITEARGPRPEAWPDSGKKGVDALH